jgi:flagellar hook-basal body complex protein FliE
VSAVAAISAALTQEAAGALAPQAVAPPLAHSQAAPAGGCGQMLTQGLSSVEHKIDKANELVKAFALDDSVPVHQVTIALEDAKLALDMAMQIRTRLVDAYREIMNMQL